MSDRFGCRELCWFGALDENGMNIFELARASGAFKADVLLRPAAQDAFDVVVRRSFPDYCCRILVDAAEEFLQ